MQLLTLNQMEDIAYEVGAASIMIGKYEWIKVTDTGSWWHVKFGEEVRIDRMKADILRMNAIYPNNGWLEYYAEDEVKHPHSCSF